MATMANDRENLSDFFNIPATTAYGRRVATDYSDPAAVVGTATFAGIHANNFGVTYPEFRPYYGDDEALRKAHAYLKRHPQKADFHKTFDEKKFAYVTLLTDDKYLPGVIMLHYSIRMAHGEYPFIVLYTRNLSKAALSALELARDSEDYAGNCKMILNSIDPLLPPAHHDVKVADPRFADTWTKLRVFEFGYKAGYGTMVYLDADMIVTHHDRIDKVFEYAKHMPLDNIAAVHDCTCSNSDYLGQEPFVSKENCVHHFPYLGDPDIPWTLIPQPGQRGPINLFNSGMFLFHPDRYTWKAMLYYFKNTTKLSEFRFPDQDFLVNFFRYRWASLPAEWNMVKTMKYRHAQYFKEAVYGERIRIMHYIVDKPWMKRTDENDKEVGFSGQDSVTHAYWWSRYQNFREQRERRDQLEFRDLVEKFVADRNGKRQIDEEN